MSTHQISEPEKIWNDIFKNKVEKDDPLWKEYVEKAVPFDERMIDEWNRVIDVILVYVVLFISVLTSFIIQTSSQLHKDPATITNDLLVVIYKQLAAQANNTPIPLVNTDSFFTLDKADYNSAVAWSALLYISLSLCIVISVMALAAKLWLVNYSHRAFSVGLPYERAMKRQEAYNGILAWRMGTIINAMPLMLLAVLLIFGFFIYYEAAPLNNQFTGIALSLGLISFGVTSIGSAFIPACPFRSVFSSAIELLFKIPQTLLKMILCEILGLKKERIRWLWIGCLAILWIGFSAVTAYATQYFTNQWIILSFVPAAITFAYAAQWEINHTTQDYRISYLMGWVALIVELLIAGGSYFCGDHLIYSSFLPFIIPYGLAMVVLVLFGWMSSGMSKSMAETGEIDAIAWLLRSTSSQDPTFFKKAGQMVVEYCGSQYRPRLLKSLMPLLSLLITSHHVSREPNPDTFSLSKRKPEEKDTQLEKMQSEDPLISLTREEVQADSVVKTPRHVPERSNSDPSSLSSQARLKILKGKNIDLNKQQFEGLNPVHSTDPVVATTSHHALNSDPSFSPKARPNSLEVQNIELKKQHEGPPIGLSPVQADPIAITSPQVPELFNSDPSSSSSKARPKLLEEKNTPLKKVQSDGPQTVLNPVEVDPQAINNEEMKTLQHLEIYVLCLALLSDFKDDEGSYRCLWEDAKRHPQLEEDLRDKLVELANPPYPPGRLRNAAIQVLNNYGLDSQGAINDLGAHTHPKRWGFTQNRTADIWRKLLHLT